MTADDDRADDAEIARLPVVREAQAR